jgi:deazaflavin-dependent oxidoreductase (nitroreductase family)
MARLPVLVRKGFFGFVGLVGFFVLFDLATTLIARYQKPKRLHRASRKLGKQLNRVYLWAIERFDIDRDSEKVVLYHRGRKSGKEYATPLCVSHCDEGFIVGDYWGPTADWFLNLKATPEARVRYRGDSYEVDAEVISIDEAHDRIGGPSQCGCWEQANTQQCVLLRLST